MMIITIVDFCSCSYATMSLVLDFQNFQVLMFDVACSTMRDSSYETPTTAVVQ